MLSPVWSDYELIDSGDFEKLERWGKFITVRPEPDCGNSSVARARSTSPAMCGMTELSINFLIKVDFPLLTGPTTPI